LTTTNFSEHWHSLFKLLHSLLGMLLFKPGTREAHTPLEKMFAPIEKCVGDSLKQLDIV